MALPDPIVTAPVLWRGPREIGPQIPVCKLLCHQAVAQCLPKWCWAAVLQEILRCHGQRYSQCALVEKHKFSAGYCCDQRTLSCQAVFRHRCNKQGDLSYVLRKEGLLLLAIVFEPISICEELRNDHPVVVRFDRGTNKHFAVVSKLSPNGSDYFLQIADPDGGLLLVLGWKLGQPVVHPRHGNLTEYFAIH